MSYLWRKFMQRESLWKSRAKKLCIILADRVETRLREDDRSIRRSRVTSTATVSHVSRRSAEPVQERDVGDSVEQAVRNGPTWPFRLPVPPSTEGPQRY